MSAYIGTADPFDKFPWTVTPYRGELAAPGRAFITTPNGLRPDGSSFPYWSVASDLWEPIAVLICRCVNSEAAAKFGTPNPSSVYADDWRTKPLFSVVDAPQPPPRSDSGRGLD